MNANLERGFVLRRMAVGLNVTPKIAKEAACPVPRCDPNGASAYVCTMETEQQCGFQMPGGSYNATCLWRRQ